MIPLRPTLHPDDGFRRLCACAPAVIVLLSAGTASAAPPATHAFDDHRWCGNGHDLSALQERMANGEVRGPDAARSRATRGTMIGDIGDVAVVEDDGTMVNANNVTDLVAIANAFYATHSDDYDHMIAFVGSNFPGDVEPEAGFAFFSRSSGHAAGIAAGRTELNEATGLNRLIGFINMNDLPEYPDDLDEDFFGSDVASSIEILGHEYGHAWAAFVQSVPGDLLGRQGAHWSFFLHHPGGPGDASVMEGNRWSEFSPGQFVTIESFSGYSQIDEYLMGLRDPSAVDSFFLVASNDPDANDSAFPRPLTPATGTRIDVTLADITALYGERLPDFATAQRHFKAAFVLVIPEGSQPLAADLDKINDFRTRFETWFSDETEGVGSVDTTLSYPPGVEPFTHTIDFEDGQFDPDVWEYVQGVTVDDGGFGETSGTMSMRLDGLWGRGDEIRSRMFDLSGHSVQDDPRIALKYHVNRAGTSSLPNADEQLHVDYWSVDGQWVPLDIFDETGASVVSFVERVHKLPTDALHDQFRFRFHRLQGRGSGLGDWFVDDISFEVIDSPRCTGDVNGDGVVDQTDLGRVIDGFHSVGGGGLGGDVNGDGVVDFRDLILVLGNFAAACP